MTKMKTMRKTEKRMLIKRKRRQRLQQKVSIIERHMHWPIFDPLTVHFLDETNTKVDSSKKEEVHDEYEGMEEWERELRRAASEAL